VVDLRLFINPRAALPIYQQLVDQIKSAAASGLFPPGSKLPSVRELAGQLAINANTVARAYSILEDQGVILRKQGVGTFVAERSVHKDISPLKQALNQLLVEAYHLQVTPEELEKLFQEALKRWNKRKEE